MRNLLITTLMMISINGVAMASNNTNTNTISMLGEDHGLSDCKISVQAKRQEGFQEAMDLIINEDNESNNLINQKDA